MDEYKQALESVLAEDVDLDGFKVIADEARNSIRVRYKGTPQQAWLFLRISTDMKLAKLRPRNCSLIVYKVKNL